MAPDGSTRPFIGRKSLRAQRWLRGNNLVFVSSPIQPNSGRIQSGPARPGSRRRKPIEPAPYKVRKECLYLILSTLNTGEAVLTASTVTM